VEIQAREILRMRQELNEILARHTVQPLEKIERDTERDFFMTGDQAREYGIVDRVIAKRGATGDISEQQSVPRLPER
jgi:ATP-dependent Clp protease protease subunit